MGTLLSSRISAAIPWNQSSRAGRGRRRRPGHLAPARADRARRAPLVGRDGGGRRGRRRRAGLAGGCRRGHRRRPWPWRGGRVSVRLARHRPPPAGRAGAAWRHGRTCLVARSAWPPAWAGRARPGGRRGGHAGARGARHRPRPALAVPSPGGRAPAGGWRLDRGAGRAGAHRPPSQAGGGAPLLGPGPARRAGGRGHRHLAGPGPGVQPRRAHRHRLRPRPGRQGRGVSGGPEPGGVARFRLLPRASADAVAGETPGGLRRLLAIEATGGAVVVLVAALLANTVPAGEVLAAASAARVRGGVQAQQLEAGPLRLQVGLEPGTVGRNLLQVQVTDPSGRLVDGLARIDLTIADQAGRAAPASVRATRVAPATYRAATDAFALPGGWRVGVAVP